MQSFVSIMVVAALLAGLIVSQPAQVGASSGFQVAHVRQRHSSASSTERKCRLAATFSAASRTAFTRSGGASPRGA